MVEQDTIKLLRECDAGVKMGVAAIDEVLGYVHSYSLKSCLRDCKTGHERLGREIETQLLKHHDTGKEPNPVAKGMSWIKTNVKLAMGESDQTVADLMTEGCNMGVKALSRYLNQYPMADEESKSITRSLIDQEEKLACHMRKYL